MRRTKEEAEQTREEILNAATQVFLEKGVAKSTLDEIAAAAGVTRGAIYWHFKNKVEIFDALHERLHRPLADLIMGDIEKDHPEPLIQLRDLCVKLLIDIENDQQRQDALSVFLLKCDYSGELAGAKERYKCKKEESFELFRRYFEKAKKIGKLPADADPEFLTMAVNCFMKGIVYEYLDDTSKFRMSERAPKLATLFFGSLT